MPGIGEILTTTRGINDFVSHSADYIQYIWSLKTLNIGQYGVSKHVDSNPIEYSDGLSLNIMHPDQVEMTFYNSFLDLVNPVEHMNTAFEEMHKLESHSASQDTIEHTQSNFGQDQDV